MTALVSETIKVIIKLSMVTAWDVAMPGTHSYAYTTCTHTHGRHNGFVYVNVLVTLK